MKKMPNEGKRRGLETKMPILGASRGFMLLVLLAMRQVRELVVQSVGTADFPGTLVIIAAA